MRKVDLAAVPAAHDEGDPPGYECGYVRIGPLLDARLLGGTVYELPPGTSNCPYHYEYGREEWLIVLDGTLSVRHPDGEDEVHAGEAACFPDGPGGAHRLTNRSDSVVRVLMLSTMGSPAVSVYPDSDNIGVFPGNEHDKLVVQRSSGVGYWEGEVEPH